MSTADDRGPRWPDSRLDQMNDEVRAQREVPGFVQTLIVRVGRLEADVKQGADDHREISRQLGHLGRELGEKIEARHKELDAKIEARHESLVEQIGEVSGRREQTTAQRWTIIGGLATTFLTVGGGIVAVVLKVLLGDAP